MKTIFMLFITATCCAQTVSQEKHAHRFIRSFIAKKYSSGKSIWILDEYGGYRAAFKMEGRNYVSSFSLKENWIQTERKMSISEIPDSAKQGFRNTKCTNSKIISVRERMFPQEPSPLYVLRVACDTHNDDGTITTEVYKLYFTTGGVLTKKELEPSDELESQPWGND